MILESQEKYLALLPDGITVEIKPFDPKARETGNEIAAELRAVLPDHEIHFWGAAALGLAGQNDIDINIFSTPDEYEKHIPTIQKLYSEPLRRGSSVKWKFARNGFEVELYLTDKNSGNIRDQKKVFDLLSNDAGLRQRYEQIKLPYGRIDFKEYMRKKYEFYNEIIGLK